MTLIVGESLKTLLETDILFGHRPENINGSSVDVTLSNVLLREKLGGNMAKVHLGTSENIPLEVHDMLRDGDYTMMPHTFLLGSTVEYLRVPLDVTVEFRLRSSMARNGLGHALAVWVDPGFEGNLTLELSNTTAFAKLILRPGLTIGQLVFHRHEAVPVAYSYATRGRYQCQSGVTSARGDSPLPNRPDGSQNSHQLDIFMDA